MLQKQINSHYAITRFYSINCYKLSAVKKLLSKINALGWAALIIWGGLSLLVLIFLIHRWLHPNIKGISARDLSTYQTFSFWLIGIFIVSRMLHYLSERRPGKRL
jgi:hypothetical protein